MDIAYIQGEGGFPLKIKITDSHNNLLRDIDISKIFFRVGGIVKRIGDGIEYDENDEVWKITLSQKDTSSMDYGIWKAYIYLTPFNEDFTVCRKFNIRISQGGVDTYE